MVSGQPERELDLDAPWRIGESAFAAIVEDLLPIRPRRIVEYGSGASSIRLALAIPDAEVVAIEHERNFYADTIRLYSSYITQDNLDVRLHPLRWRLHARGIYYSYSKVSLKQEIDAAIIDGPPYWTGRGREACLYDIAKHLRLGGRIYLDDFHRSAEQEIVRSWLAAYPSIFSVRSLNVGHGIAILEKLNVGKTPRLDFPYFLNTVRVAFGVSRRLIRARSLNLVRLSSKS